MFRYHLLVTNIVFGVETSRICIIVCVGEKQTHRCNAWPMKLNTGHKTWVIFYKTVNTNITVENKLVSLKGYISPIQTVDVLCGDMKSFTGGRRQFYCCLKQQCLCFWTLENILGQYTFSPQSLFGLCQSNEGELSFLHLAQWKCQKCQTRGDTQVEKKSTSEGPNTNWLNWPR